MAYVLWIALSCGLVGMTWLGIEVLANYMRREREEGHLE